MDITFTYTNDKEAFDNYMKYKSCFNAELKLNNEEKIVVIKSTTYQDSTDEEPWGLPDILF